MSNTIQPSTRDDCNPTTTNKLTSFLTLPSELRNRIYELALLHQEPIDPWNGYNRVQELTVGLLRASNTVHRETSSLFYAQNRFDFTIRTPEDIASFLEQIGSNNATYIRHICIDFPRFRCLDLGSIALEEDSIGIFANISSYCTNMSTLTTSLDSTNAMELELDGLDNPNIVIEALRSVNACFRGISSIQEIVVEVYEDSPSDHIRNTMRNHGWTISTTEYVEEEEQGRGWSDDDYGFSDYDGGGDYDDDDYDIDNDSDFWRRAGD